MADIKELKKLVAFMRKTGVTEYKSGEIELKLSPEAPQKRTYNKKINVSEQIDVIPTDEPTREELLFWSAGGAEQPTEEN